MDLLLILVWLVSTLIVVTVFAVVAKKYGVQFLTVAMAASILLANLTATKFVDIFGYFVPASVIIFSMTFLISDMLSEFWGKKEAQKAVWAGFMAIILYLLVIKITILWPVAPFSVEAGEKFSDLFSLAPRIALGGILSYIVAQNFDVWFYHKIKEYTHDKYLWLRNNLSTITSQLLDSIVFFSLAFLGTAFFPTVSSLFVPIITLWLIKVAIAIFDTPFMYILRSIVKRV